MLCDFILRELSVLPNTLYNQNLLESYYQRIFTTRYFLFCVKFLKLRHILGGPYLPFGSV
jgi:hypothetical protein